MTLFRSVVFTLIFYTGSIPLVALALLSAIFGQGVLLVTARFWARWHRLCARFLLGIRTRVEGTIPQHGVLVALKHESMFETIDLLLEFDRPAVIFKKELLAIPVWGRAAQLHGVIPIDREGGASALRMMLNAGKAALAADRPLLIFPEGTRVEHGDAPPLGAGLAGLYRMLGTPLVPVALDSGNVWPRGFVKRSGVVTYKVGEEIPPGLPREEMEARVHAAINALNG